MLMPVEWAMAAHHQCSRQACGMVHGIPNDSMKVAALITVSTMYGAVAVAGWLFVNMRLSDLRDHGTISGFFRMTAGAWTILFCFIPLLSMVLLPVRHHSLVMLDRIGRVSAMAGDASPPRSPLGQLLLRRAAFGLAKLAILSLVYAVGWLWSVLIAVVVFLIAHW